MDYSPFSKKRDKQIETWCKNKKIEFNCLEDMLLHNILSGNSLNPKTKKPYTIFSFFTKNLKKYNINPIENVKINSNNYNIISNELIDETKIKSYFKINENKHVIGSRYKA